MGVCRSLNIDLKFGHTLQYFKTDSVHSDVTVHPLSTILFTAWLILHH